jgi:hypothetical protein
MRITMVAAALAALVSLAPERTMAQDLPPGASTPAELPFDVVTNGTIDYDGDQDAYRITLTKGQNVALAAYSDACPGDLTVSAFKLFDANFRLIKSGAPTTYFGLWLEHTAAYTGVYFVQATVSAASCGPDDIGRFYFVTAGNDCAGNSLTKCKFLPGGSFGLYEHTDVDWHIWNVTTAGHYRVYASTSSKANHAWYGAFSIRRADSSAIAGSASSPCRTAFIPCAEANLIPGKYFIAIRDNDTLNPPGSAKFSVVKVN